MTTDIRWFRERLGSASLPWPVLVTIGAAAALILLARGATNAEAAGLGPAPLPPAALASRSAELLPTVNEPVRSLLAARDTARALVPAVDQTLDPAVQRATTAAAQAASDLAASHPLPPILVPLGSSRGPGLPAVERLSRGPVGLARGAAYSPSTPPSAVESRRSLTPGQLPTIPGLPDPALPGLPATATAAVVGPVAPGGTTLGLAAGLWLPFLGAHVPRGSPVQAQRTDLGSLVERPG